MIYSSNFYKFASPECLARKLLAMQNLVRNNFTPKQYFAGCLPISTFLEEHMGLPRRLVALKTKAGTCAHFVNFHKGRIIDLKQSWGVSRNGPVCLGEVGQVGKHIIPTNRTAENYILNPTVEMMNTPKRKEEFLRFQKVNRAHNWREEIDHLHKYFKLASCLSPTTRK